MNKFWKWIKSWFHQSIIYSGPIKDVWVYTGVGWAKLLTEKDENSNVIIHSIGKTDGDV